MSRTTRPWDTPSITVIGAGTPAEGVLAFCKLFVAGVGPNSANSTCWLDQPNCYSACHQHSVSS
jgi:hypothetical protein